MNGSGGEDSRSLSTLTLTRRTSQPLTCDGRFASGPQAGGFGPRSHVKGWKVRSGESGGTGSKRRRLAAKVGPGLPSGRSSRPRPPPASAASCRRRETYESMFLSGAMRAATAGQRRACSQTQSVSSERRVRTTSRRSSGTPSCTAAGG